MRTRITTALTVVGAITILVLAGNTIALATTGKALISGKTNTSAKVTTISRTTPGTALQVKTKKATNAPFAVNGKGRVTNLNADKLDGLDAKALKTTTYYSSSSITEPTTSFGLSIPVPPGRYLVSYSMSLASGNDGDVSCYIYEYTELGEAVNVGHSAFRAGGAAPGVSGTGLTRKDVGGDLFVTCNSTVPFKTYSDTPIQIVATRVDAPIKITSERAW